MSDEYNWKSDPNVFLDMKVKYAMLLGFLQGCVFAGMKTDSKEYHDVMTQVDDMILEFVGDIYNCGWDEQHPTVNHLVETADKWLNDQFPVPEIENENEKTD